MVQLSPKVLASEEKATISTSTTTIMNVVAESYLAIFDESVKSSLTSPREAIGQIVPHVPP